MGCDCDEVGFSFDDLPPVLDVVDPVSASVVFSFYDSLTHLIYIYI